MDTLFRPMTMFIVLSTLLFLSIIPSNTASNHDANSIPDKFAQCLRNSSDAIFFSAENGPSFESLLHTRISNRMYTKPDTPRPLFIVIAENESHVRATILCAKLQGSLEIRVRSGGHDFEASSSVSSKPFVVLDMIKFRSIKILNYAEDAAWVGAGATLGELYYKIAEGSNVLGFPASVCPGVAAGGHVSGGGYGNMMRMYGLSSDHVVDALIMDANGSVRDRSSMGEDVFWALRGGGGGSFGVILSLKVRLVKVPEIVTVFEVKRSFERGSFEALHRWQFVAPNLPKEVFIRALVGVANNSVEISFKGQFLGRSNELVSLLGKRFPELGLKIEECHETSWVDSNVFWDGHPIGTSREVLLKRLNGSSLYSKIKSDYVKNPISKRDLRTILGEISKAGGALSMKWNPYGGKMEEISESESPFPHRAGNLFMIQYLVVWSEDGNEAEKKYLNIVREFYEKMTPFVSKNPREAFFNYRDYDVGVNSENNSDYARAMIFGRKFFKNNFERLVKAKTIIDPDNFFKNQQSIPIA